MHCSVWFSEVPYLVVKLSPSAAFHLSEQVALQHTLFLTTYGSIYFRAFIDARDHQTKQ